MSRTMVLLLCGAMSFASTAHAQNYGAGSCQFPNTQMFPTIQAAVNAVPAGSTIAICPGVYPEQVTISKPLTLQGRAFGNASRAVVTVPPGPQSANVTNDFWSFPTFAQVLVQNANTPGPVNITGITVDGNGALDENGLPLCTTGIFYSSGTSGTVNEVTTRNQIGIAPNQPGNNLPCGYGIWAENEPGPSQSVTIENSSVHEFGWAGITTYTRDDNPTLNATIHANFVNGPSVLSAIASDATSTISNNLVTPGGQDGINVRPPGGFGPGGSAMISTNTVAGSTSQSAIDSLGNSTIQSNNISDSYFGIAGSGGDVISSNHVLNTTYAVALDCASSASNVTKNVINDSTIALLGAKQGGLLGNQVDNSDQIHNSSSCP